MSVCPTCHAQLEPNARFCPKDGTTVRPDSVLVALPPELRAQTDAAAPSPGSAPPPPMTASSPAPPPSRTQAGEVDAFKPTVAMIPPKRRRASTATTDPAADPMIGKTLDGRYRIAARLGQGGVGAVYEAEHVQMKKVVAIKVLHPIYASTEEFRKRFEREARAVSRLSHPSIVQVTDFGSVEKVEPPDEKMRGTPYLVMEFVKGRVLLDRLIEGPAIPPPEAVAIVRDVLSALKHAHSLGIVHRDIKPANMMLTDGAGTSVTRVKLLDFGLAKELLAEGGDKEQPLTQAGMVFGTPGYLSPEQAAGRPIDARADLYSLGVVLFEMVCNRRLFERKDPLDAVRDHLNTPPPDPRTINPNVSPELAKVILKSLEKNRDKRFADAGAFADALASCPEASGASAKPAWWRRPLGKFQLWQVAAAGGGALVLLVGGALLLRGSPTPKPTTTAAPTQVAARPSPPRGHGMTPAAAHHLELAHGYQRRLWCSDAVEELDRALREDPSLSSDPEVARVAISCLRDKTFGKASRFLVERIGDAARPELEQAATSEPNPEVRRNAQRLLEHR